jgi:tRNA G10  N-methylase Trm11
MNYFFITGHKTDLSKAELKSVLLLFSVKSQVRQESETLLTAEISNPAVATEVFLKLGGFIKYGQIVDDPYKYLERLLKEKAPTERIIYSISFYPSDDRKSQISMDLKKRLGGELKHWLEDSDHKCRFIANFRDLETSEVLIYKKNILERGFDLDLFETEKGQRFWGITSGVQDFEDFAKRDFDRPRSDKQSGMLPPKLARIMVNLARQKENSTIWDPFCGCGTILQEAVLSGHKAIGSDVSESAVENTTVNMDWISKEYGISNDKYRVFKHDIGDGLPAKIKFNAIVTEPYLGPVLKDSISEEQYQEIQHEVSPVYDSLFNSILTAQSRKMHGILVLVVPSYRTYDGWETIPLKQYRGIIDQTHTISQSMLHWDRPHSIIRRHIKIFEY